MYKRQAQGGGAPFDLLLHLILQEQVDLYEVSLSSIVEAYIRGIQGMEEVEFELTTDFLMIAAYISTALLLAKVPVVVVVLVVLVCLAVLGWGLERIALRPLDRLKAKAGEYSWVLTTMGVALILQNTATLFWGKSAQYSPPLFSSSRQDVVRLFGVGVFVEELVVIAVGFLVVGLFPNLFLDKINPSTEALLIQVKGQAAVAQDAR